MGRAMLIGALSSLLYFRKTPGANSPIYGIRQWSHLSERHVTGWASELQGSHKTHER